MLGRKEEFEDGSDGGGGGRIVEGLNGGAVVAAGEGIDGVGIGVAGGAKGGSVGIAGDGGRSLIADLTEPDTWVARAGEGVELGVAAKAEEDGVVAAEEGGGGGLAGVAEGFGGGDAGPAAGEGLHNWKWKWNWECVIKCRNGEIGRAHV